MPNLANENEKQQVRPNSQEKISVANMYRVGAQEKSLQQLKRDLYSWLQTYTNFHNVLDCTNQ